MQNINNIIQECIEAFLIREENENVIEPTTAWMNQKYNEFNSSIFDNKLPKCRLVVSTLPPNTLGRFNISKSAIMKSMIGLGVAVMPNGDSYETINRQTFYRLMKPKITLNASYAVNEKDLENTLIHEMCHYYTCFDENGEFRLMDTENKCHGADFEQAAQMVSQKTNGAVTIKQLADAERMDTLAAAKDYNKGGIKIYTCAHHGKQIFFYVKDDSVVQSYYEVFKWDLQFTTNPTLLMLLKRYGYQITSIKTFLSKKMINAYSINEAPQIIQDAFNESEWQKYNPITK